MARAGYFDIRNGVIPQLCTSTPGQCAISIIRLASAVRTSDAIAGLASSILTLAQASSNALAIISVCSRLNLVSARRDRIGMDADRNRMGSATSADAENIPVLVQYKAWRENPPDWTGLPQCVQGRGRPWSQAVGAFPVLARVGGLEPALNTQSRLGTAGHLLGQVMPRAARPGRFLPRE